MKLCAQFVVRLAKLLVDCGYGSDYTLGCVSVCDIGVLWLNA